MSLQKLHYENISGTLVRREGLLSWRCPLCKAEGRSPEVMHTCPECGSKEATLPGAQEQNVPKAVAYLDLGTGGYMDIGTDLTDEALAALPKGRHMLGIVGTYGVDGYVPAQNAPSVPDGWKLVPIEPTQEMSEAGVYAGSIYYDVAEATYEAMLAAAPEAKL